MTFTDQIDDLTTALRHTRGRLLAPLDYTQQQLPRDPSIFVEDVLHYVMDQWAVDLAEQGHGLEEEAWSASSDYPRYLLHLANGQLARLRFGGEYPRELLLDISKGASSPEQLATARSVTIELPITLDPNVLLASLLDGMKGITV